jgi:hypothetical protein
LSDTQPLETSLMTDLEEVNAFELAVQRNKLVRSSMGMSKTGLSTREHARLDKTQHIADGLGAARNAVHVSHLKLSAVSALEVEYLPSPLPSLSRQRPASQAERAKSSECRRSAELSEHAAGVVARNGFFGKYTEHMRNMEDPHFSDPGVARRERVQYIKENYTPRHRFMVPPPPSPSFQTLVRECDLRSQPAAAAPLCRCECRLDCAGGVSSPQNPPAAGDAGR